MEKHCLYSLKTHLLNQNKAHYNDSLSLIQSILLKKYVDFTRGHDRIQTFTFSEHCNGGYFTRYPFNASANGDLREAVRVFEYNT